jgi:hypothetical protein
MTICDWTVTGYRRVEPVFGMRLAPYNDTYDFISAMASLRFRCER